MKEKLIETYLRQFCRKYLQSDIFEAYPETKIIPGYIKQHFSGAEFVLDLGFGTGLWFWASFFPRLKRIDGFDLYPEALAEAERVFAYDHVPEGYCLAHRYWAEDFTLADLRELEKKRGYLVIQDYRESWPEPIKSTRYDLVTEHGGGLATMRSDQEFIEVVKCSAQVLKPSGCMLFVNFSMKEPSGFERELQRDTQAVRLRPELFAEAADTAGMKLIDFHTIREPQEMPEVQAFFYGYAQKLQ